MSRSSERRGLRSRAPSTRIVMFICALVTGIVSGSGASAANTARSEALDPCVGLECSYPGGAFFVPEAEASVDQVTELGDLDTERKDSGFFKLPAVVYSGEVQPQAVVYFSRAGQHDRLPESVRALTAVRDFFRDSAAADTTTLVVVDHGIILVRPKPGAKTAVRARLSSYQDPSGRCGDRKFCIFPITSYGIGLEYQYVVDGPTYVGTGWRNFGRNFGSSMVNFRGGDSLLADHGLGTGTEYCAGEYSHDTTFANNAIGNDNASSWALLYSTVDRC